MSLAHLYGNVVSGQLGGTLPQNARIGMDATILNGRDREPAKVTIIVSSEKTGKVKGFMLQRFQWTVDANTEGYPKTIHWDQPIGSPSFHRVRTHGRLKGTVEDALIGYADAFYDRTF